MNRPRRPIIVAHRGLHDQLPENSLAAMTAAWAAGVQWAECDVHQTRDDLYVLHDDSLDRTTDAAGPVATATLAGVRLRDAALRVTAHPVPTLAAVIAAMPPAGRLLVEVKAVHDFARFVRDLAARDVWVQSFDAHDLTQTRQQDASIPLAFLVETDGGLRSALSGPFASVHINVDMLTDAVAADLRRAGKSIGVWTVNDEPALRRVVTLGVDAIITDQPALAKRVVDAVCGAG